jgi:hypothetical protein
LDGVAATDRSLAMTVSDLQVAARAAFLLAAVAMVVLSI